MTDRPEFQKYLKSIAATYAQWWDRYTLMDAVGKEKIKRRTENCDFPFEFGLMVQTAKSAADRVPEELREKAEPPEKLERLPVLDGMRKYADEHVLLVGRPGSGKSTALIRLLLEAGEAATGNAAAKIPVLVELRYWQTGVIDRILTVLQQGDCLALDAATLKSWLRQGRLLLLLDGLNELPSEEARRDVATFRRDYPQTPMVFTTRELSVGGDLGIAKKLEMQPLTEIQMQEFVQAYLPPDQAEQMLRQLKERLRELGQTPLLLWMLCGLFQRLGTVPPNLGLVFRQFTQGYERSLKQDIPVTAESRRWWSLVLQQLAIAMMQGENPQEKPTEFLVAIARPVAEAIVTQYLTAEKFDKPRDFAKQWLEDLLKHHLIQLNGDKIEFRHQLIQEYYAAEWLLAQLPKLSDATLQQQYLNYLKWTEPIALMLALVEDEELAVRVVELAIGVDLMLGARLAGAVKSDLQKVTVGFILSQNVPKSLKLNLLGETHSDVAIPSLLEDLQSSVDVHRQMNSAFALRILGSKTAVPDLIRLLTHQDERVVVNAALVLGAMGDSSAIPDLLNALNHSSPNVRAEVASSLGESSAKEAVPKLIEKLRDEDHHVRQEVVAALGEIEDENSIPELIKIALDNNHLLSDYALTALKKINSEKATEELLSRLKLEHRNHRIRDKAVEALGIIGSASAVESLLEELLKDSANCWIVAEALKEIGGQSVILELRKVLEHQNLHHPAREYAAYILGELGDKEAVSKLIDVLDFSDWSVLERVIEALGKLGDSTAIQPLTRFTQDGRDKTSISKVYQNAIVALGKLGSDIAKPHLLKMLEEQSPYNMRPADWAQVCNALENLGGDDVVEAFLKALKSSNPPIRWFSAEALGNLGAPKAIKGLLAALEDENSSVRHYAAKALGKLPSQIIIPELSQLLQDPNKKDETREAAILALGESHSEEAVQELLELLKAEEAKSLGKLPSQIIVPELSQLLQDPNKKNETREAAVLALGESHSEEAVLELLKLLKAEEANICYYVIEALKEIGSATALNSLHQTQKLRDENFVYAIATIQSRCKFYNYEIFQAAQAIAPLIAPENPQAIAPHYYFPNAQEVKIFESVNTYNENKPND